MDDTVLEEVLGRSSLDRIASETADALSGTGIPLDRDL